MRIVLPIGTKSVPFCLLKLVAVTAGELVALGDLTVLCDVGSSYFVNMVQGGGLWGFDGIRRTLELMTEAFLEEKAPEDLIICKGWGCESCI